MGIHNEMDELAAQGLLGHSFNDQMKYAMRTQFAVEKPMGKILRSQQGGRPQTDTPPAQEIQENREIVDNDPHIAEAIETLVDYLVGSGFSVKPRNIPGTDAELAVNDIAEIKQLVETSRFESILWNWVWHALVDGMAFLEINWEEGLVFKPRLLPPERIEIQRDEFGEIVAYMFDSEGDDEPHEYGKYDVAHLGFWKHPEEAWCHSLVRRARTQAEMLSDMEIDMARFVATKAYPPILWKLGSEENEWNQAEINSWLDDVAQVEPDSVLAGPHDIEAEAVGVTDTSATSGAMDLNPTFQHLERRMTTGLGLPFFLLNGESPGRNDAVAMMPKFDRRIQRLRVPIRDAMEQQVFRSLFYHPTPEENEGEIVPRFDFNEHSSDEERLEIDAGLKLLNAGMITREALATRLGIDPETELPSMEYLQSELIPVLTQLAGKGDQMQNPNGGHPTETGSGTRSSGEEVKTRQNPERAETDRSRPQSSIDNE